MKSTPSLRLELLAVEIRSFGMTQDNVRRDAMNRWAEQLEREAQRLKGIEAPTSHAAGVADVSGSHPVIELEAVLSCERCNREVRMLNIDSVTEAWQRALEADWCEDEDGNEVCPECWAKWDAENALVSQAKGGVTP